MTVPECQIDTIYNGGAWIPSKIDTSKVKRCRDEVVEKSDWVFKHKPDKSEMKTLTPVVWKIGL